MKLKKFNKFIKNKRTFSSGDLKKTFKNDDFLDEKPSDNDWIPDEIISSLLESFGFNISMDTFVNKISDEIINHLSDRVINLNLIINKLGTTKIKINIYNNEELLSIYKNNNILIIDYGYITKPDINKGRSDIDHELHHMFINEKGNKTKKDYFIVNNLLQIYTKGKTRGFLHLYYLSFKDEISCNIQMVSRQLLDSDIKTKKEFTEFITHHELYLAAKKMIDIDVIKYWYEINKEGNGSDIVSKLGIGNLGNFFIGVSKQIKNAGEIYIKRLSRIYGLKTIT